MKEKGAKTPKMGDLQLKCPLCCDKTFNSKPALKEHLKNLMNNIVCPICKDKCSSLADLIQHLSLESCQVSSKKTDIDQKSKTKKIKKEGSLSAAKNNQKDSKSAEEGSAKKEMYVELLDKQQLKVVKKGDINQYILLPNEDSPFKFDGSGSSKVVTKQNNDGTISLTAVEDIKKETVNPARAEVPEVTEEEGEEIYSCNTCGISFTSVLDHIQNYHNDQDVVVEEQVDAVDSPGNEMLVEHSDDPLDSNAEQDTGNHKSGPRRMITETGDIVEEPMYIKNATISLGQSDSKKGLEPQIKEERVDKLGRSFTRRYIVVDKQVDSVVKDIKPPEDKSGPYHKVVIKVVESADGEEMRVFHCMSCNAYVTNLDEFKSRPCKQLRYRCPHCTVSYENHKSLCAHMKVHKMRPDDIIMDTPLPMPPPPPTQMECEVCNTQFQSHKSLKLHRRMHDPVKARPIEPPVQGVNGGEVSADQFLCSVCDKLIPMDYRKIHVASHKDIHEIHCDICNKRFTSRSYLEMHMSVHSAEKSRVDKEDESLQYKCLYCHRRFARPHEKVKHERIHTGEKPHSCEICGKSFRVSYCLTLHMRTHTGARPYECAHCGKRFKAHSVYNHHLMTHSDVRAYKCSFCPKAFKTSVQLAGHRNSHTKPFSCQYCNRPFASLYAVRIHTETHKRANNLKFNCSLCGASYARAFALKDHMKQAHDTHTDNIVETMGYLVPQPVKKVKFFCSLCGASYARAFALKDHMKQAHDTHTDNVETMDTSEKESEWVTPDVKGITNEVDISELAVTIENNIGAVS